MFGEDFNSMCIKVYNKLLVITEKLRLLISKQVVNKNFSLFAHTNSFLSLKFLYLVCFPLEQHYELRITWRTISFN